MKVFSSFLFFTLVILASYFIVPSTQIQFNVEMSKEFCIREELAADTLVSATYTIGQGFNLQMYIKVEDPNNSIIWTDPDASTGKFSVTTLMAGVYSFCFIDMGRIGTMPPPGQSRRVTFDLRTGLLAKDYAEIAKKEHLEPLELEFRKMEDLVEVINQQLQYLRDRDFEARDTSEATNSRVVWLSVVSTSLLVILGISQIYLFYSYLKHKKVL